jgi:hypothetical protein
MQGHCLCGAIRVRAPDRDEVNACHCSMCRRWSGGPLMVVHCGSEIDIEGRERLTVYRSSEWAERAFCGTCGSHVYYRLLPVNEFLLSSGLFQDGPQFRFVEQIFVDEKPVFYDFANATRKLTGAQVMAQFDAGTAP